MKQMRQLTRKQVKKAMAPLRVDPVIASTAKVKGRPLNDLIGTNELTNEAWDEIRAHVKQGGKRIIQLRGRSSWQSPSHQSLLMLKAVIEQLQSLIKKIDTATGTIELRSIGSL